ncbi:hypothetical protein ACHAPZ_006438 [Fusarium culmorum]
MDTQTTSGSRWVECLLDIDGSIIPGSTLRPIGPGLHVRAKLEMGLYVKPAMKLQFSVQHQSQTHLFAISIIPLQMILGKPHIADVQTADQVSLHPLLAHQQMGRFEPPRVSDPFMSTVPEEEQHHALDIANITKTVRTLRVDVSRGDVIIFKPPLFHQKRNTHPQAVQEIADAVMERLELPPQAKFRLWFFPESTFADYWWKALKNIGAYARPYAAMLAQVRRTGYAGLSYDSFVMEDLKHPDKPVPSTSLFLDGEQQTVSVMGGAIGEITLQNDLASKSLFSLAPKDDDLKVYGISADYQPLRWYFIVDISNGVADIFPDVDVPFHAYLRVEYEDRPMPSVIFSSESLIRTRRGIIQALRLAETKGEMQERPCQAQVDKAIEQENEAKQDILQEKLASVRDDVYTNVAAESLYSMITVPSPAAIEQHADKPVDVQLAATALDLAADLRQRHGESDIDWDSRICDWLRNDTLGRTLQYTTDLEQSYKIVRRQLLPETHADIALCEVTTANQSNWPLGMKKPSLKVNLPHVTIEGPINEFLASVWQPVKGYRATTVHPTVSFEAWFQPNDTSIKAECDAITKLNAMPNAPAKGFWKYTQRFGECKEHHNWLAQYPTLGRQFRDHHYIGERHNMLSRLNKVPFGYAAITGGPGSGKTSLAEDIVLAVVSEPCKEAIVTRTSPSAEPADDPIVESIEPEQENNVNLFDPTLQLPTAWCDVPEDAPADAPEIGRPKAAWIVAENRLCDDAQVRLSIKEPGILTLRARPWKCEMENMYSPSDKEPILIPIDEKPHATSQDRRLAEHVNHQADYISAYKQKHLDPECSLLNHARHEEYARKLLIHVLTSKVDIIYCTPVTFAQIVSHAKVEMGFIVLNGANCMTESMSLIPMSKCPEASFLLIGDARQFGPVTTVDRNGSIQYRLKCNYRARGYAADFIRKEFYDGQMNIMKKKATPATTAITEYLADKTGSHYPNVFIDVPEAAEVRVGTSYANPATAHLAISLAIQLYRLPSKLSV